MSIPLTAPAPLELTPLPPSNTVVRAWRALQARRGPAAPHWILCCLVLAVLWGGLMAVTISNHRDADRERAGLVGTTAKGFSEYVGLHVLIVDRILQGVRTNFPRTGTVAAHQELQKELGLMAPMLLQVAVANAEGAVVASSLPLQPGISIADRPHFKAFAQDPTDRLHFSQPVVGRVSGKMSLQLVRPILGPRGEFQGVVVASIDPLKLQQYFDSVDALKADGVVTISGRQDAIVRARFAGQSITWGQSLHESVAWPKMSGQRSGTYESASRIDGVPRTFGFHQVGDYPLLVNVGSRSAPWWELDSGLMSACLMALAFTVLLVRQTRLLVRRDAEQTLVIDRLRASRAREIEANRMKTHFLASVSHELRTPLNSILGFSELISEIAEDESIRKYSDLIHGSGKHLHSLVNTLLDMAKIEAGRMEVENEQVELTQLVNTMVDVHRVNADRKGLGMTASFDLPEGTQLCAETDRTKLTQVLNNVLHNAVKFTREGGVFVTGTMEKDTLLLRVVDTGPGIPPNRLAQIFERFTPGAGTRENEGSGLGLALSRELMTLLGGSIALYSEPGQGTQVEIRLPHVQARKENTPS